MKRRGFLGLLGALPFVRPTKPETDWTPRVEQPELPPLPWNKPDVSIPSPPAYSFSNDSDTGIYRIDSDKVGIAVHGHKVMEFKRTRNV